MKRRPRRIGDTHEIALRPRLIDLRRDRRPDEPLRRIIRRRGLPTDAHDGPHGRIHRLPATAQQNHGGRSMAGDVGPARVDDVREVCLRKKLLDELLAKLALHKRVGRDLPGESACRAQLEDVLHEGDSERILHVAGGEPFAVAVAKPRVLGRDIRRIGHHGVVLPMPQERLPLHQIFRRIGMLTLFVGLRLRPLVKKLLHAADQRRMKERIATLDVDPKGRSVGQLCYVAGPHRHEQKAKSGDRHGKGIDVDAMNAFKRPADQLANGGGRLLFLPSLEDFLERPQHKMPGAAGWIDHLEFFSQAIFSKRRIERALQ